MAVQETEGLPLDGSMNEEEDSAVHCATGRRALARIWDLEISKICWSCWRHLARSPGRLWKFAMSLGVLSLETFGGLLGG